MELATFPWKVSTFSLPIREDEKTKEMLLLFLCAVFLLRFFSRISSTTSVITFWKQTSCSIKSCREREHDDSSGKNVLETQYFPLENFCLLITQALILRRRDDLGTRFFAVKNVMTRTAQGASRRKKVFYIWRDPANLDGITFLVHVRDGWSLQQLLQELAASLYNVIYLVGKRKLFCKSDEYESYAT